MAEEQPEMKVAIVEDHPMTAEMLSDLLVAIVHCETLIFHTAQKAIDYFEKQMREAPADLPGLVILDLGLPDKNGMVVLKKLRAHDALKDIPVIINTGSDNLEDLDEAKKCERVVFLKKGVDQFTLSDIIMKLKADGLLSI